MLRTYDMKQARKMLRNTSRSIYHNTQCWKSERNLYFQRTIIYSWYQQSMRRMVLMQYGLVGMK